jgi:transposase-like protein
VPRAVLVALQTFFDYSARAHKSTPMPQRDSVSVAVIIAVGVNSDGRCEILGMDIGPSEAETFWIGLQLGTAARHCQSR